MPKLWHEKKSANSKVVVIRRELSDAEKLERLTKDVEKIKAKK